MGRPIISGRLQVDLELEQAELLKRSLAESGERRTPAVFLHSREGSPADSEDSPPPSPTSAELISERPLPFNSEEAFIIKLLGLTSTLSPRAKALVPDLSPTALRRTTRFEEIETQAGHFTLRAWENNRVAGVVRKTETEMEEIDEEQAALESSDDDDAFSESDEDPVGNLSMRMRSRVGHPCGSRTLADRAQELASELGIRELNLRSLRSPQSSPPPLGSDHASRSRMNLGRLLSSPPYQEPLPVRRPPPPPNLTASQANLRTLLARQRVASGSSPYMVASRVRRDVHSDTDSEGDAPVSPAIARRVSSSNSRPTQPRSRPLSFIDITAHNHSRSDTSRPPHPYANVSPPRRVPLASDNQDFRPPPRIITPPLAPTFYPDGDGPETDMSMQASSEIRDSEESVLLSTPPISPNPESGAAALFAPSSAIFHSRTLDIPLAAPPLSRRTSTPLPPSDVILREAPPGRARAMRGLGAGWAAEAMRGTMSQGS